MNDKLEKAFRDGQKALRSEKEIEDLDIANGTKFIRTLWQHLEENERLIAEANFELGPLHTDNFRLYQRHRGNGPFYYSNVHWYQGQLFCRIEDERGYSILFESDSPLQAAEKILFAVGAGRISLNHDE
jgi:hypothetical protein